MEKGYKKSSFEDQAPERLWGHLRPAHPVTCDPFGPETGSLAMSGLGGAWGG